MLMGRLYHDLNHANTEKKYYLSTNDQQVESPYVHNGEDNPMLFTALCCTYNMAPML